MKILFISPKAKKTKDPLTPSFGLLSIATYLKQYNHTVKIYESAFSRVSFTEVLKEFLPDIIGITLMSGKAIEDTIAISKAAQDAGVTVVWGGNLPSTMPELCLKTGCVDIISIGEGEYTWLDLLDSIETGRSLDTVNGLAYMKDGEFIKTPERDFVNLEELPVLDFDLIDVNKYVYSFYVSEKTFNLYSAKGCPGHCTYCYNPNFHKSTNRTRNPEHVVREITHLINKYGIDGINFNNDIMFRNKEELYKFCSLIKEAKLNFYWGCASTIGSFGKEELQYMYDFGCRWIFFGVESGSKEMLKKIKKGITYDKIEQTFIDCADIGISARAGFIIGFPGETEAELRDTISLALRLKTIHISFNYYTIVPLSEEYQKLISEGKMVSPKSIQDFASDYPFDELMNFSNIPDKELKSIFAYLFLRRLFAKDSTVIGKPNSWWSITSGFVRKSLQESSLEKFYTTVSFVPRLVFNFISHPRIIKKYKLRWK